MKPSNEIFGDFSENSLLNNDISSLPPVSQGRQGTETHAPVPKMTIGQLGASPTMQKIQQTYLELFGSLMTEKQIENVFEVANKLGTPPSDGIWYVLLALENYQRLYLQGPWAITSAVRGCLQELRDESSAQARDVVAESRKDIARIVREAAKGGRTGWDFWRTQIFTILGGILLFCLGFFIGQVFPKVAISHKVWDLLYN